VKWANILLKLNMRRTIPYALKGIGIVLFGWILIRIDLQQAIESIAQASTISIVVAFAFFPVIYLLKSWRWHILAHAAGANTNFWQSVHLYMSGLFLGTATPGKLGEAMKIPALTARGLSLKDAMSITVLDRLLDVGVIGMVAIWAAGVLVSTTLAGILLACVLCTIAVAFMLRRQVRKLLPAIGLRSWCPALALTALNWCVYFLQLWILAQGFGFSIALPVFVAIMTITGIISLLPIAPAGLGTRDAALLFFFGNLGIALEQIIAFSFTIFVLTIIASSIGAYFWLRYPLQRRATE